MKEFILFLGIFSVLSGAQAKQDPFTMSQPLNYQVVQSKALFKLAYTLGTVEGETNALQGGILWNPTSFTLEKAQFKISLSSLHTGDPEKDCHLREAVGLDYSKSDFPKSHVCSKDNTLPTSGPNAVSFPEIRFSMEAPHVLSEEQKAHYQVHRSFQFQTNAEWEIHGVKNKRPITLTIQPQPNGKILVSSQIRLSLDSFKIQVKPFLFIKVSDEVRVDLSLELGQTT